MKRFLKKALRWTAIVFVTLAVLLLVLYAEEDWRGARDWAACQRDLAAKGETLDLRQLVPPGNPEDDLSMVPIFAEMYQAQRDYDKNRRSFDHLQIDKINIEFNSKYSSSFPKMADYLKGQPIDLTVWQNFYRTLPEAGLSSPTGTPAQDVLKALSQLDPELDEIRAAVSNPNAYWPINYENPFDGYLGCIAKSIEIAKIIQLEGKAYLDNHQPDLAQKDYLFSFQLNQPLAKGCFTVNYLIMVVVRDIDDSILWEGLRQHAWSDVQLREMESALAASDLLALGAESFRVQRASACRTIELMHNDYKLIRRALEYGNEGYVFLYLTADIRPNGWWNQDRVTCGEGIQKYIDAIDLNRQTLAATPFTFQLTPNSQGYYPDYDTNIWNQIYTPLGEQMGYALRSEGQKIAKAATYTRLARLACRLEEYRIAHGAYPDKLDDLPDLPAHLNQEVLSEQPLQYHHKGDSYQLYSLGWNQKDDGGIYIAPGSPDGDWPWPGP